MAKMSKNSGKRRENGVVIAWSSFLSINIIARARCDYSFVFKNGGGIKGLPISRQKWYKMAKNGKEVAFQ